MIKDLDYRPVKITTTRLVLAAAVLLSGNLFIETTNAWPRTAYPVAAVSLQQEDGWVAIKTDEGMLFVWNVRGLYFSRGEAEAAPSEDSASLFRD